MYHKFYKKTRQERIDILTKMDRYAAQLDVALPDTIYTQMIENALTTYDVPLGVAPNFVINQRETLVAMATEEPSVIAAANNAAKIIAQNGGFTARVESRIMTGQIAFSNPENPEKLAAYIDENSDMLSNICHNAYPSIVKRGGGVVSMEHQYLQKEGMTSFFILYIHVDTQEAMGANMMNTMLEAVSEYMTSIFNLDPLMAILSNLATRCLVHATVRIDPQTLKFPETTAKRIVQASDLACLDPYRAATHNKGIMNGIDAVVLASGNDTRAIEAGAHAYATVSGTYQPLATWKLADDGSLVGFLTLPMPVGSLGGSIGIHPKAQLAKKIMNYDHAKTLMEIIASVGLGQNFAALYALTTEGIQKGHMALQARSLAIQAGAPLQHLEAIVAILVQRKPMNLETCEAIIQEFKHQ